MNELKPYIGPHPIDHTLTEYYLKSEADKVIAEKDEKIDLYKRGFEENDKINAHLYAELKEHNENYRFDNKNMLHKIMKQDVELRHHKYKRCLDKAELCERKRIDAANYRIPRKKWEFYEKWHKRYLELAEKFKEAK